MICQIVVVKKDTMMKRIISNLNVINVLLNVNSVGTPNCVILVVILYSVHLIAFKRNTDFSKLDQGIKRSKMKKIHSVNKNVLTVRILMIFVQNALLRRKIE